MLLAFSTIIGVVIGQVSDVARSLHGWDAAGLWGVCALCAATFVAAVAIFMRSF